MENKSHHTSIGQTKKLQPAVWLLQIIVLMLDHWSIFSRLAFPVCEPHCSDCQSLKKDITCLGCVVLVVPQYPWLPRPSAGSSLMIFFPLLDMSVCLSPGLTPLVAANESSLKYRCIFRCPVRAVLQRRVTWLDSWKHNREECKEDRIVDSNWQVGNWGPSTES